MQSITPERTRSGLGSFHSARRYSGNRFFFLFLRVLRCFSSPGSLPCVMYWRMDGQGFLAGFPHSDTCGSKDVCSSPQLFAAYHVFHRLLVPRHPPCALISLTLLYIKNIALPFIYLLSFMTALFKTNLAFSVKFLDVWLIYIYIYKLSLTVYSFQGTTTCHYTAWHAGQLGCPSLATGTMPAATDRQPGVCLFSFYISFFNLAATCSPMPSPA